tara:strand:- start:556 stop:771 length:216 start_codon:yes stop_codon:yes gene_type:complete
MNNYTFLHALNENAENIKIPASSYHEALSILLDKGGEYATCYYLIHVETEYISTFAHCPSFSPIPQQPLNN